MSFPFRALHFAALRERLLYAAGLPVALLPACVEEHIPPDRDAATQDAAPPRCPSTAVDRQCFSHPELVQKAAFSFSMIDGSTRIRSDAEAELLFLSNGCLPPGYVFESCCNPARSAGEPSQGGCCYTFCVESCCGRPFFVSGEARRAAVVPRSDWLSALPDGAGDVEQLPAWVRARLTEAWLEDARMEHASVAAFARFSLELLAHGAPAGLVLAAQRAGADEVQHARMCFALASRYAGRSLGPDRLFTADVRPAASLRESVLSAAVEGCVGETLAALRAQAALAQARCPAVREVLTRIVLDETRHAELAFGYVAWALRRGDAALADDLAALLREEELRSVAAGREQAVDARGTAREHPVDAPAREQAVDAPAQELEAGRAVLRDHGRLAPEQERALRRSAFSQVIAPCFRALLTGTGPSAAERVPEASEQV